MDTSHACRKLVELVYNEKWPPRDRVNILSWRFSSTAILSVLFFPLFNLTSLFLSIVLIKRHGWILSLTKLYGFWLHFGNWNSLHFVISFPVDDKYFCCYLVPDGHKHRKCLRYNYQPQVDGKSFVGWVFNIITLWHKHGCVWTTFVKDKLNHGHNEADHEHYIGPSIANVV